MPRVMCDFDGPIHQYSRGWQDGSIYDPPVLGSREALDNMRESGYEVVIFSTRDADQIADWLNRQGWYPYRVTNIKEPAVAYIDDRAIHWDGDWSAAMTELIDRYPVSGR